nr:hypothetical protein [Acidobacteriota bacterium]
MTHRMTMKTPVRLIAACFLLWGINRPAECQSIELDKQLGAENAAVVEEQMGLYPDTKLTTYLIEVGQRLVS